MDQKLTSNELVQMITTQQSIINTLENRLQNAGVGSHKDSLNYYDLFYSLVAMTHEENLAVPSLKNTERSRNFISFTKASVDSLLERLVPEKKQRKDFEEFLRCMELVIYKDDGKKVVVTKDGTRVPGCLIAKEKYNYILSKKMGVD